MDLNRHLRQAVVRSGRVSHSPSPIDELAPVLLQERSSGTTEQVAIQIAPASCELKRHSPEMLRQGGLQKHLQ